MQITTAIHRYLGLEEDKLGRKEVIILCILAYLFGVLCRSFYIFNAAQNAPYVLFDGFPMINTEDGYHFAELIKQIVIGHPDGTYTTFLRPNGPGSLTFLTWLAYILTPWKIEQVAVYIPLIFAPLTALPFIFIGRLFGNTLFGFGAGVLSSVGNAFFRRTSFAYYDTDLFTLTAPALVVLAGIYTVLNPNLRAAAMVAITLVISGWLDKSVLVTPLYLTFLAIFIPMHFRNEDFPKMLIMLSVPLLSGIPWYYLLICCLISYTLLNLARNYSIPRIAATTEKRVWMIVACVFFAYVIFNHPIFDIIRGYIGAYGESGRGVVSAQGTGWSYYQVTGTIVEARTVNLTELARATSGHISIFLVSLFGAFLALIRFPLLIIGGGLLGLGFFASYGGIRFSMYLTPIVSIGAAYLIMLLKKYIRLNSEHLAKSLVWVGAPIMTLVHRHILKAKYSDWKIVRLSAPILSRANRYNPLKFRYLDWGIAIVLLAILLYPNVRQAYMQPARAVARIPQINMLQDLSESTTYDDYIISWWDYGYVMRYYSNMHTIIDGAKHQNDNYIVSKAFSSTSQVLAANLLREGVEAYANINQTTFITDILFGDRRRKEQPNNLITRMKDPDYVLQRPATRDIYLYIPYQMLRIYGVVRYFSDLNLVTGDILRVPFMNTQSYRVDRKNNKIFMPSNIVVDLKNGDILRGREVLGQINTFYNHRVVNNKSEIRPYRINALGSFSVILSNYYHTLYVAGPSVMNSNFIQMFFFRNYDKKYFELVAENPFAVLYKLKRPDTLSEDNTQSPAN